MLYTSNSEYSDTVSHLDNTECISDKGTVAKLVRPFQITPPTWHWEEEALIHPPLDHVNPDFFVNGTVTQRALAAAWDSEARQTSRQRAREGEAVDVALPSAPAPNNDQENNAEDEDEDEPPSLSPSKGNQPTYEDVLKDLRSDTIWFCKPAGRDYGGGMILGNSIQDCLDNPNFDKADTYVRISL